MTASRWSGRTAVAGLPLAAALLIAACGGSAGDLVALEVSGGHEGAPVRLTVTEDGRGSCDGDELEPISSQALIEARDVERDLEGMASDGASLGGRPAADRRSYVVRTRAGTVRWVEGTTGLPDVLPRAALLAEQLRERLCEERQAAAAGPRYERTLPFERARSLARST